jgi:hypothetical protein
LITKVRAHLPNITDKEVFYCLFFDVWYIIKNNEGVIMHDLKDRLKEPTSYLGLASVFQGIGECLQGNYESGLPLVLLGLVGIFKAERGNAK